MKDICIIEDSSSDIITSIGNILGVANVNIEGLSLATYNDKSIVHFVVEDVTTAINTLEKSGFNIASVSEIFVLNKDTKGITGKAGSFGEICELFLENNIKINFGYPAENNRFIFGIDNISKAKSIMEAKGYI